MKKILLCIEDYNEMLFLEGLLKKLGFVVETIRNETAIAERVLGFSPEVVIASGDGQKINGGRVSKKVKKKGSSTKLILLFPRLKLRNQNILTQYEADAAVETPLNPRSIINSICQVCGISPDAIIQKFEKLSIGKEAANESVQIVHGKNNIVKVDGPVLPTAEEEQKRMKKYAEILKEAPKSHLNGFPHNRIADEIVEIRKWEVENNVTSLDEERKSFVRALFKKSS
jgi:DNA-binding response OmpR family regulator